VPTGTTTIQKSRSSKLLQLFTDGLEQFDYVAARIFQQDLLTSWTGDDVVSERQACGRRREAPAVVRFRFRLVPTG
jgi:hypothetical protein